jgi:SAM-dependent methyltransferase
MSPRHCPCCGAGPKQARIFLEERLDPSQLTALSFASRKTPEFMNLRLVQCEVCDLVYADMPPGQDELARAYHASEFDSAQEADDAAQAYIQAIAPALTKLRSRQSGLEIGAGTGTFLDKLVAAGFENVIGVEPSPAAISAAPSHRKAWIRESIFHAADFDAASLDLVCCFMTLEHVRDPGELTRGVASLLRPGGLFVAVVHDWRAPINRLLGRRSPIIDIEHMQLFSAQSIERLFSQAGLTEVQSKSFSNRYELRYWTKLLPLPNAVRGPLMRGMDITRLGSIKISANVGNRVCWGWRH